MITTMTRTLAVLGAMLLVALLAWAVIQALPGADGAGTERDALARSFEPEHDTTRPRRPAGAFERHDATGGALGAELAKTGVVLTVGAAAGAALAAGLRRRSRRPGGTLPRAP